GGFLVTRRRPLMDNPPLGARLFEAIALSIKTDGAICCGRRIFSLPRETLGFDVFLGQVPPIARN
ncbi:hypothetical protein LCGC14_1255110, partial [marine sediment metagenome]